MSKNFSIWWTNNVWKWKTERTTKYYVCVQTFESLARWQWLRRWWIFSIHFSCEVVFQGHCTWLLNMLPMATWGISCGSTDRPTPTATRLRCPSSAHRSRWLIKTCCHLPSKLQEEWNICLQKWWAFRLLSLAFVNKWFASTFQIDYHVLDVIQNKSEMRTGRKRFLQEAEDHFEHHFKTILFNCGLL